MTWPTQCRVLEAARASEAVDVLCEAFSDYPVMRYVVGTDGEGSYEQRLRRLLAFFVNARVLRQEPVFGVTDSSGVLVAAAVVTLPGDRPSSDAVARAREALWEALGADARGRYETYVGVASRFRLPDAHHHLNMIGVRRAHQGHGLARQLLQAVHDLAERDVTSLGVSLATEVEANVRLYEHLGYRLLGRERVAETFDTWAMFRPREGS